MPANNSCPTLHRLYTTSQPAHLAAPSTQQQSPLVYANAASHSIAPSTDWSQVPAHATFHYYANYTTPPTSGSIATATDYANRCKWLVDGVPCGQHFSTFDELVLHLARKHDVQGPAERKLVCEWWTHRGPCGNQYRRDAYRRHIATHLHITFPCTVTDCNKSFSRADSLRSHIRRKHLEG